MEVKKIKVTKEVEVEKKVFEFTEDEARLIEVVLRGLDWDWYEGRDIPDTGKTLLDVLWVSLDGHFPIGNCI